MSIKVPLQSRQLIPSTESTTPAKTPSRQQAVMNATGKLARMTLGNDPVAFMQKESFKYGKLGGERVTNILTSKLEQVAFSTRVNASTLFSQLGAIDQMRALMGRTDQEAYRQEERRQRPPNPTV